MTTLRRQRGVAIITAVAIAALVAALAATMAWRYAVWFRQVENQHDLAQARSVARAAVDLARLTLQDDARRAGQVDHAGEPWAIPIPNLQVEQGSAGGRISDAQGKFNLNNLIRNGLASEPDVTALQRLLAQLQLSPSLVYPLLDWIDADGEVRSPDGAEDQYYLGLTPPYRTANQPLVDLADLERVKGFNADTVRKLQPYVTALPQYTSINVNFAPAEVLYAVIPNLEMATAGDLVRKREGQPFLNFDAFRAALPQKAAEGLSNERVNVTSRYFTSDVDARFGRVAVAYRALLERNDMRVPTVIWMRRR